MDTTVLKGVPLFKDLDAEDLEGLGELMSETSLKRGDALFREGDEGDRLYVLTEGKVKLSHSSDDGRENLIAVLGPGEIIGELSLFDLGARSSTVTAIAPTKLLSLSHKDMMVFLAAHPELSQSMLRELARRLSDLFVETPLRREPRRRQWPRRTKLLLDARAPRNPGYIGVRDARVLVDFAE